MQKHNNSTPNISHNGRSVNPFIFISCVSSLYPLSNTLIVRLSERFSISPESLVILIELARKEVGIVWN